MKKTKGEKLVHRATRQVLGCVLLLLTLPTAGLLAQTATPPPQTFSATIYLDYRFFLSNSGPITLKPTDPSAPYLSNQFVFRRAYLTYENKINDNLKFRFTFDADNTANVTGVALTGSPVSGASLTKDDKLRPYMKYIYFEWSNFLIPDQTLKVGMEQTLTFKIAEDKWNYRSVVKTLLDGYKDITGEDIDATSADLGASLQGRIIKQLRYGVQVVNGSGYTHLEGDKYKKFEGNIQLVPVAGFTIGGYMDYEQQQSVTPTATANPLNVASPKATTYKLESFFEMVKGLTLGGEWFVYKNDLKQYRPDTTTPWARYNVSGWSGWGRYTLIQDRLNAFARYDSYVPNSLKRAKDMTLAILGVDWAPTHASLKLQPNVWIVSYKDGRQYKPAATSNTDVIFNLTFFMSF
jgi:hypothetical protein